MRYMYAIVNDIGRCYEVRRSTDYICNKNYIPIIDISVKYLSKYYYPMPQIVDSGADFIGKWYHDIDHTIEVKF